jgi:hypothetical protein
MIGGEATFPCIVVNLGKFVRDLEDQDWRRGHLSLHCCQPRGLENQDCMKHQLPLLTKLDLIVVVTGRDVILWSSGDRYSQLAWSHVLSLYLSFSPVPFRDVITWSSGDRLLTAGPVTCSLSILVYLLLQVEK